MGKRRHNGWSVALGTFSGNDEPLGHNEEGDLGREKEMPYADDDYFCMRLVMHWAFPI